MDKDILITSVTLAVLCLAGVIIVFFALLSRKYHRALQDMENRYRQELADRTHAEESRQRLEKAFLQGQKLQAIGTLAGGIAHDFNNILYAIMGYIEMTREDTDPTSITYVNLGKVLAAAKRGQDLISRILTFSRRQHHDLHVISLRETIEGALDLLRPTIPTSVGIHTELTGEDCIISGNQTQLHQVMVNLVTNAVDAMEGEGDITVRLDSVPANSPLIRELPHPAREGYCRLSVTDTGHGIDPANIERIFEPFFTTKEVGRGTGLGLSTVHSIVTEHKGEIMVDSHPGLGTTFTLFLPIHDPKGEENNGKNPVG